MLLFNGRIVRTTTCSTRATSRGFRLVTAPRAPDAALPSNRTTTTSSSLLGKGRVVACASGDDGWAAFGTNPPDVSGANANASSSIDANANAPRSYTSEHSVDGDESYSLFGSPDFGPPENAHHENEPAAASSWGSGVSPGSGRDFHPENYPAAVALQDPHDLDVVSRTSAHTTHPHVVSVRLTRPITDHVTFAPRTPPPTTVVAELADESNFDLEPTGAVVVAVNPTLPGLAHGVIKPGDVLACLVDQWKHPVGFFVSEEPFSRIAKALSENTNRPLTLRFLRFTDNEEDVEPGEFLGSHVGDRTSVRGSHLR